MSVGILKGVFAMPFLLLVYNVKKELPNGQLFLCLF